jgi:1,6-anhydro-N-acetylmuramate kinase
VAEHNANTPFSELPENIGLQLTALSATYPNARAQISQLAASLGELYSKNQREIVKQKRLSLLGVAIGLIGVIAAVVVPLLPQQSNRAHTSQARDSATPAATSTVPR